VSTEDGRQRAAGDTSARWPPGHERTGDDAEGQGCGDLWSRRCGRGAVARAFAREGATLFLTGRPLAPVQAVAEDIAATGGSAEAAEVDALDEQAVDEHLESVTAKADRVDISFNAIGIPNPKRRAPLVELDLEQFSLPITTYTRAYFLTARLAARRMVAQGFGGDHDRHRDPVADRHPVRGRRGTGDGGGGGAHSGPVG
jgi:NAD(P)-dependent dehydrogenase (short-subunit alcohol dehydrogenase family)